MYNFCMAEQAKNTISKTDMMEALEEFFSKKPEFLLEALHEVMEDIWAKESSKKSKKLGLANKEDVLNSLYGN